MVSEGGRKFACQMSMYERRGLSTNNAWLNVLPGRVYRVNAKYQMG